MRAALIGFRKLLAGPSPLYAAQRPEGRVHGICACELAVARRREHEMRVFRCVTNPAPTAATLVEIVVALAQPVPMTKRAVSGAISFGEGWRE